MCAMMAKLRIKRASMCLENKLVSAVRRARRLSGLQVIAYHSLSGSCMVVIPANDRLGAVFRCMEAFTRWVSRSRWVFRCERRKWRRFSFRRQAGGYRYVAIARPAPRRTLLRIGTVGKATKHAGMTALYRTPMHAAKATLLMLIANIRRTLSYVTAVASSSRRLTDGKPSRTTLSPGSPAFTA